MIPSPITTLAFAAGIVVGVIAMAAAKTLAALALPIGLAIAAAAVYWKKRKGRARSVS